MEKKDVIFLDKKKRTPVLSNTTFLNEIKFDAYTRSAPNRELYFSVKGIEDDYPELADQIRALALDESINKTPV